MIGQTVSHYRVLRVLGEGGMGVVYEAEDTRLGRHVALKFISGGNLDRQESVERFLREARAASALSHPNICTLYDVGEVDGNHFIALELLEGETLDSLLLEGPLPTPRLLDIAVQIAEGLDAAHARGVIHRDVKPGNVFVTRTGLVKLMDFGLAKLQKSPDTEPIYNDDITREPTANLTRPGSAIGTVSFMSPEQARGQDVDARADIFAFGTMLYLMAVGVAPFRGPTNAVILSAILEHPPTPPQEVAPHISPALSQIILKALEKNRDQRYPTARRVLEDLKTLKRTLESRPRLSDSEVSFVRLPSTALEAARSSPPSSLVRLPGRRVAIVASAAAALALLAGLAIYRRAKPSAMPVAKAPAAPAAAEIRSLAVLPFENLSREASQDYFSDGMTDELITKLSGISALRVISRTSAMHYKGLKKSLPEIGRELQVDAVVEGSVLRSEDRIRINVRLSRLPDESLVWAEGYERDLKDVLSLQGEVANAIARAIRVKVAPTEVSRLASKGTVDPEAYQLTLQGRTAFGRFTPDSLKQANDYFTLAIAKDPKYALAYAGLADSYIQLAGRQRPPHEVMPRARAAIQRALELDPELAEAHSSLAQVRLFYEFDWEGAGTEFRRAVENGSASALVHQMQALFHASQGRFEEALVESKRALDVDPVSSSSSCQRARILYYARRYEEAIRQYQKTLETDPTATGSCTWALFAFHKASRLPEAIAAAEHSIDVSPNENLPKSALARAYALSGDRAAAERTVARLHETAKRRFVSEYEFAVAYSGWDPEQSLAWLEKAYSGRVGMLVYLKVDAVFDELRSDPRFQDIVQRVGVP